MSQRSTLLYKPSLAPLAYADVDAGNGSVCLRFRS
jgi:hypothetical protein